MRGHNEGEGQNHECFERVGVYASILHAPPHPSRILTGIVSNPSVLMVRTPLVLFSITTLVLYCSISAPHTQILPVVMHWLKGRREKRAQAEAEERARQEALEAVAKEKRDKDAAEKAVVKKAADAKKAAKKGGRRKEKRKNEKQTKLLLETIAKRRDDKRRDDEEKMETKSESNWFMDLFSGCKGDKS